jgi:hypothetical protein
MKSHDSSRVGDYAECKAVAWLWEQGYEVFKNSGCSGPIDLIVMAHDGTLIPIDVKTARLTVRKRGDSTKYSSNCSLTEYQRELGVQILTYNPVEETYSFQRHKHETTYARHRDNNGSQYDLDLRH